MNQSKFLLMVLIAIIFALSLTFVSIAIGFNAENNLRAQAAKSAAVLNNLRRAEAALLNAETGQRGYILTQDRKYLEPFTTGSNNFAKAVAELSSIIAASEENMERESLNRLKSVGAEKLAELSDTISLAENGNLSAAIETVQSDRGKRLMEDFRGLVSTLESEEQKILTDVSAEAQALQDRAWLVLIFILVLILMLLALIFFLFKSLERLNRTEELLDEVSVHRDRATLLARELSHRVKNIFGIVAAIVRMTGRGESDATVVVQKISERIGALSRAHALTATGANETDVDLEQLIRTILEPYETDERSYTLSGPSVAIDSTVLTPLGLILHEMATNAVKYGAWSPGKSGVINVRWEKRSASEAGHDGGDLWLIWSEVAESQTDAPGADEASEPEPVSTGFGTRMIQMSVQQLNGQMKKKWNDGLVVELTFDNRNIDKPKDD